MRTKEKPSRLFQGETNLPYGTYSGVLHGSAKYCWLLYLPLLLVISLHESPVPESLSQRLPLGFPSGITATFFLPTPLRWASCEKPDCLVGKTESCSRLWCFEGAIQCSDLDGEVNVLKYKKSRAVFYYLCNFPKDLINWSSEWSEGENSVWKQNSPWELIISGTPKKLFWRSCGEGFQPSSDARFSPQSVFFLHFIYFHHEALIF